MKTVTVPFLAFESEFPLLEEISDSLDTLARNKIDQLNWLDFDYKPEVEFAIGYTNMEILLKYHVTEEYFKAEMTESSQNVFEDSCVEFFVAPNDDGIYYNLEFNAIGTCLLGTGRSRADRQRAAQGIIGSIRRISSEGTIPFPERTGKKRWDITMAIPFSVFFHHNIKSVKGEVWRVNFYKCGDKLTKPHYLTWNPVKTEKPDFHRPDFFGTLRFV